MWQLLKIFTFIAVAFGVITALAYNEVSAADIQPDGLEYKIIESGARYTKVSFKFNVQNNEEPREIFIKIAGKDASGFELERVNTSIKLQSNESRTITKVNSVSNDSLQKIVTWEFSDIRQFPDRK